eukprot:10690065-Alexandrium_andersonii.AAC.1
MSSWYDKMHSCGSIVKPNFAVDPDALAPTTLEAEYDFEKKCAVVWCGGTRLESGDLSPMLKEKGGQSPVQASFHWQ